MNSHHQWILLGTLEIVTHPVVHRSRQTCQSSSQRGAAEARRILCLLEAGTVIYAEQRVGHGVGSWHVAGTWVSKAHGHITD